MRIVIDMQGAQTESRFRGIGRYTLSFAEAVVRNRGEHEVVLALSGLFPDTIEPIRAAFNGLLPQEHIRVWCAPGPIREEDPGNHARREVAELIREAFLASLQPDIIHITSLFEGYVDDAVTSIGRFDRRTPVSVSLYDLIPLLNPDHYLKPRPSYAAYYERKIKSLKEAGILLAISAYTRQEGLDCLGVDEERIVNVSTAIGAEFQPATVTEEAACGLRHKFGLTHPFVLCTGGADERKNLPRLIEAWSLLPPTLRQTHQLLLAGKMPEGNVAELCCMARNHGLRPDELLFSGYVSDEELIQIYNLSKLYVFPSWHEGFGLPALEAMSCGAPVIGASTTSLPEVIGIDEALFNPFGVVDIARKLAQALEDEHFREKLRKHGLNQAKQFCWDATARKAVAAWTTRQVSSDCAVNLLEGRRKARLAFVSPLPPERTGIADYSAALLPALAEYYDIELIVEQDHDVDTHWVDMHGSIRSIAWLRANVHHIDRVLYQMGNSPFHAHMLDLLQDIPGVVVVHDFYLSGLMSWLEVVAGCRHAWMIQLYRSHGYRAVHEYGIDIDCAKRKYPANWSVLQRAQGIIVHSEYSRRLASEWYGPDTATAWKVIPLLRQAATPLDRNVVRRQLDLDENDFVICSLGFLDPSKQNHRLLRVWLNSSLAKDVRCHLIFVGQNHGGEYGAQLLDMIQISGCADRIRITGFVLESVFQQYLAAADLAVQLRTDSRGETSAAVLDCMNHGLPVIVNANGSMAELDAEAVWLLPDSFDDEHLSVALETLWGSEAQRQALGERAQSVVHRYHAPSQCARAYAEAIEGFHVASATAVPELIGVITEMLHAGRESADLSNLAGALATTFPSLRPAKRLYLDITATCSNDLKTGIERVARALVKSLLIAPPDGYRIEPVYLSSTGGRWHYRHACGYTLGLLGQEAKNVLQDDVVDPQCGDVLVGLDISGDRLVCAEQSGLHASYRAQGCKVYYMVYDLLPLRMPEVFPPGADDGHQRWLSTILRGDGAICISRAVADDLQAWMAETGMRTGVRRPFDVQWLHLGADISNSVASVGLPYGTKAVLNEFRSRISFLMVGTIEPRKGHLQVIEAFTQLWRDGVDVNLVIVGYEGWKALPLAMRRDIPEAIERLRKHPEFDRRLFWLEGISDEYLEKVYLVSDCLIAASYGEGFGLPLIEAAQHRLPIIARDLPVFHEVAGDYAYYFNADGPQQLALAVRDWLDLYRADMHPRSDDMPWLTWQESATSLTQIVLDQQSINLAKSGHLKAMQKN